MSTLHPVWVSKASAIQRKGRWGVRVIVIKDAVVKATNRPLPSSENPQFQNEAKCTTFLVKISFIFMRMKNHFYVKGWALNLVLVRRPGGTRKWPIRATLLEIDIVFYHPRIGVRYCASCFSVVVYSQLEQIAATWNKEIYCATVLFARVAKWETSFSIFVYISL